MGLLEIIIILLVIAWLGGFSLKVGGGLIHLLLIIAVIILIARLLGVQV
ncbi:MAG: lmo0937 family membrane protein [Candidatus Levybacteria bacterium]|nr:lmo0937 family membrane protein [Candidatus Levybacteria bacterium]